MLGAGFSRNWGGFLADEAFGYLIGCPEVRADAAVQAALHRRRTAGGFESALSDIQGSYLHSKGATEKASLDRAQSAITSMFAAMDKGFAERPFEPQNDIAYLVRTFLAKFDAIYSLNQDCLPEIRYLNDNVMLGSSGKWAGWQLPGMRPVHDPNRDPLRPTPGKRTPDAANFRVAPNLQPFIKLHGSHNWIADGGDPLMILGANKSTSIAALDVLRWYLDLFGQEFDKPTRLMIIGYGFRDPHINENLLTAARAKRLELFLVDALGADALDQNNNTKRGAIYVRSEIDEILSPALIGTSNRSLLSTFNEDRTEHAKFMRFFD
ncbi:MAG: hypothetical protein NTZ72_03590 [Afipia sp.]|nr:hypothetical protein [Afipia sp.]